MPGWGTNMNLITTIIGPGHRIHGLAPLVVAAIPTVNFNREAFNNNSMENTQCAICLSDYQEKEVMRIMPKCGHTFHVSCIDIWLRKQSTCPVCRLSVQGTTAPTSEISTQHSRQWLLPTATAHNSHSIAIELEATSTSS
ncbi:hypothetical protein ACS0TY_002510 [Phlomoides rotata]